MTLLIGALTMGIILALLALGVYLSFRIFNIPDMTAEGAVTLGASVAAVMMVNHYNPFLCHHRRCPCRNRRRSSYRHPCHQVQNHRPAQWNSGYDRTV